MRILFTHERMDLFFFFFALEPGPAVPSFQQQQSCRTDTQSQHYFSSSGASNAPPATPPDNPTASSHPTYHRVDGTLAARSRSNSAELLLESPNGSTEDYHESDGSRSRTRAVENQYSFYWWILFKATSLLVFLKLDVSIMAGIHKVLVCHMNSSKNRCCYDDTRNLLPKWWKETMIRGPLVGKVQRAIL